MTASELGKVAGTRWANARLKKNERVGRLTVANTAGAYHLKALDRGLFIQDVVPYCQAFIDAAFAVLDPAGLVTL